MDFGLFKSQGHLNDLELPGVVSFIPATGNRTAMCSPQLSLLPGLKIQIYIQWQSFGQGSNQINRIKEVARNGLKALQRTTPEPVVIMKSKQSTSTIWSVKLSLKFWLYNTSWVFLSANFISYTYLTIAEQLIAQAELKRPLLGLSSD